MVGLLDIGPLTKTITVAGKKLTLRGLTVTDVIDLMQKYEGVKTLLEQGADGLEDKLDAPSLIATLPKAVWSIFAICTGDPGNEKAEKKAATLPLSLQVSILRGILDVTFQDGVGPFVEDLNALTGGMKEMTAANEKASANGSQPPSASSLQVDLPQKGRVRLHPVN